MTQGRLHGISNDKSRSVELSKVLAQLDVLRAIQTSAVSPRFPGCPVRGSVIPLNAARPHLLTGRLDREVGQPLEKWVFTIS